MLGVFNLKNCTFPWIIFKNFAYNRVNIAYFTA